MKLLLTSKLSFIRGILPLERYQVIGHSMEPTLHNGKLVWVNKLAYLFQEPQKNDVIVFENQGKMFIKRIDKVGKEEVSVIGDNAQDSLDSRTFGKVKIEEIIGKVLIK